MSQFNIEVQDTGAEAVFMFSGQIDEDTTFGDLKLDKPKVIFDFEKVSLINSCGIREWIKWIRSAETTSQLVYRKCPKVIVDQINMVSGFLPENGTVESFYVPYYCEETGNEKMVLFKSGSEFNGSEVNAPEDIKDDETGDEMEMDVIEAKYFKFLKG